MKKCFLFLILMFFWGDINAQQLENNVELKKDYIQLSGTLFRDVQLSGVFKDSKTFVDAVPLKDPKIIEQNYNSLKGQPDFDLLQFLSVNFDIPEDSGKEDTLTSSKNMREHIRSLWTRLTRRPSEIKDNSTLLPLENPYVVPGGRFREVYYWDSFFTILGLLADNRANLVENMISNFAGLLEHYAMIPNGNRVYYLTRSQPPFFSLMVDIMCRYKNDYQWGAKYLNALEIEYRFWMNGLNDLTAGQGSSERVVRLENRGVLNRYFDFDTIPREESFREDYSLGIQTDSSLRSIYYRHLRAGAESGWDFSSRWFSDTMNLKTVRTTDILPVDLNCLLYFLEDRIAMFHEINGNLERSEIFRNKAALRTKLINQMFWDEDKGYFFDYNWREGSNTGVYSLAGVYPLYFGLVDEHRAEKVMNNIKEKFLQAGGLVTTLYQTGQQWDAPNGWAPLQWMVIKGLREYGYIDIAEEIKSKWLKINMSVFERTGKMFEKYNVQDLTLYAGGGEYPLQDGFGWTNGVAAALLEGFDVKYLFREKK